MSLRFIIGARAGRANRSHCFRSIISMLKERAVGGGDSVFFCCRGRRRLLIAQRMLACGGGAEWVFAACASSRFDELGRRS